MVIQSGVWDEGREILRIGGDAFRKPSRSQGTKQVEELLRALPEEGEDSNA
jgi:hypothetical protein